MKHEKPAVTHHMGEEDIFLVLSMMKEEKGGTGVTHHLEEGEVILAMAEKGEEYDRTHPITHHLDEGDVFSSMIH